MPGLLFYEARFGISFFFCLVLVIFRFIRVPRETNFRLILSYEQSILQSSTARRLPHIRMLIDCFRGLFEVNLR